MRKLFLCICLLNAFRMVAQIQDCSTGYCPATITVHHKIGVVAPETVDITYEVVKNAYSGTTQCWIARNLGATTVPTSATDNSLTAFGWVWQFGQKRGLKSDGTNLTPASGWIVGNYTTSGWPASSDPCTLLLGSKWRLPTAAEYSNVITNAAISTGYTAAFNSTLKFHAGGFASWNSIIRSGEGSLAYYWSSNGNGTINGNALYITNTETKVLVGISGSGCAMPLRCLSSLLP